MNFLLKRLVVAIAASLAMQSLMNRQQDIGLDMPPDTLHKRSTETATVAMGFAKSLWAAMEAESY